MKVDLTKSQCVSVADFIEMNLLDVIRKDVDLDRIEYVQDLLTAKDALEKAAEEAEEKNEAHNHNLRPM